MAKKPAVKLTALPNLLKKIRQRIGPSPIAEQQLLNRSWRAVGDDIVHRPVMPLKIFPLLETQAAGKGGEIQLTDALRRLAKEQPMYAYDFKGHRYDVGTKTGFLQANIEFALRDDSLKREMKEYLDALHQYMEPMLHYE